MPKAIPLSYAYPFIYQIVVGRVAKVDAGTWLPGTEGGGFPPVSREIEMRGASLYDDVRRCSGYSAPGLDFGF